MTFTVKHIQHLLIAKRIYLGSPTGVPDEELAALLDVSRATATRYRTELHTMRTSPGRYTMVPTNLDILYALTILKRAKAEGLYNVVASNTDTDKRAAAD